MEVTDQSDRCLAYYVGMTGDNYYPSARSAFHRLAGHFDRASRTTQRQLGNGIDRQLANYNLNDLVIKMHHYAIDGFVPIEGASNKKGPDHFSKPKFTEQYAAYRTRRSAVHQLEQYVIHLFHQADVKVFNKNVRQANLPKNGDLVSIANDVKRRFLNRGE